MDGEGVEGVAEFMGDSGGKAHDGINAFALDAFFEGDLVFGDVGEDHDVTAAIGRADLGGNGHHIKAEVAAFGIGELDFAGEDGFRGAGTVHALRVDGAGEVGHHFPEAGGADVVFLETDDAEGGGVGVLHDAIGINDEDAILNGIEDGFLKFALAGEALDENTEVDRVEILNSAQDFIKPGIFHMPL